ncbi:FAD/NAD(P)-binding domain-containing protein [Aspergillus indologenus CBS 114.80]|uniref:FAD/NAD(P)-binding domain-containing protein n=1 Tax=Aspergillus indologenus CBS 114.80 TaxID=1450541 RepID=A0A2V5IK34_9EURO|nr:FAD/NAD(P)-binding domain-containing protein [Aspergillus indologenus CBS 114.80]
MAFKVAIVGAGPAGCLLARLLLHQPKFAVTVFEAEPSINYRAQGGSLDLHENGGLAALKAAGLYEEFLKHARFDGEALLVCDKQLKPYIQLSPTTKEHSRGRPEIDRSALRRMLVESLPPGTIQWKRPLRRVVAADTAEPRQAYTLEFADGTTASGFDLIVGADGAWSKVRAALSDTVPRYAGIGGFALQIPDAARTAPACAARLKGGAIFAYSTGCMLAGQQLGDGSINVGLWRARPEGWEQRVDYPLTDPAAVRAAQMREFGDYAPELVDFIAHVGEDSPVASRSFYTLPVGFRWDHRPGLTLVGDAAHVICPFTGEGVNQALKDVLQLAQALAALVRPSDLDSALLKYEAELFARAAVFQKRAEDVAQMMFFTEGSPATTIERYTMQNMQNSMSSGAYKALYPLLLTGVYGYFFWHKRLHK